MNLPPIEAIVIIAIGAPLGIWWYLSQIKMIWNAVTAWKVFTDQPLGWEPPGNLKSAMKKISQIKKEKEKEDDENNPAYGEMYQ